MYNKWIMYYDEICDTWRSFMKPWQFESGLIGICYITAGVLLCVMAFYLMRIAIYGL